MYLFQINKKNGYREYNLNGYLRAFSLENTLIYQASQFLLN